MVISSPEVRLSTGYSLRQEGEGVCLTAPDGTVTQLDKTELSVGAKALRLKGCRQELTLTDEGSFVLKAKGVNYVSRRNDPLPGRLAGTSTEVVATTAGTLRTPYQELTPLLPLEALGIAPRLDDEPVEGSATRSVLRGVGMGLKLVGRLTIPLSLAAGVGTWIAAGFVNGLCGYAAATFLALGAGFAGDRLYEATSDRHEFVQRFSGAPPLARGKAHFVRWQGGTPAPGRSATADARLERLELVLTNGVRLSDSGEGLEIAKGRKSVAVPGARLSMVDGQLEVRESYLSIRFAPDGSLQLPDQASGLKFPSLYEVLRVAEDPEGAYLDGHEDEIIINDFSVQVRK